MGLKVVGKVQDVTSNGCFLLVNYLLDVVAEPHHYLQNSELHKSFVIMALVLLFDVNKFFLRQLPDFSGGSYANKLQFFVALDPEVEVTFMLNEGKQLLVESGLNL